VKAAFRDFGFYRYQLIVFGAEGGLDFFAIHGFYSRLKKL
jgi:hypothetical protein